MDDDDEGDGVYHRFVEEDGIYHTLGADSVVTINDTLRVLKSCVRQIEFVTPVAVTANEIGVDIDIDIDHYAEAGKLFDFLQHWVSCRVYDRLYKLMSDSEGNCLRTNRSEFVCVADLCDTYDIIQEFERTILVLDSVKKSYAEGACSTCMSQAVQAMVDNEILLLRRKVTLLADDTDESEDDLL